MYRLPTDGSMPRGVVRKNDKANMYKDSLQLNKKTAIAAVLKFIV